MQIITIVLAWIVLMLAAIVLFQWIRTNRQRTVSAIVEPPKESTEARTDNLRKEGTVGNTFERAPGYDLRENMRVSDLPDGCAIASITGMVVAVNNGMFHVLLPDVQRKINGQLVGNTTGLFRTPPGFTVELGQQVKLIYIIADVRVDTTPKEQA